MHWTSVLDLIQASARKLIVPSRPVREYMTVPCGKPAVSSRHAFRIRGKRSAYLRLTIGFNRFFLHFQQAGLGVATGLVGRHDRQVEVVTVACHVYRKLEGQLSVLEHRIVVRYRLAVDADGYLVQIRNVQDITCDQVGALRQNRRTRPRLRQHDHRLGNHHRFGIHYGFAVGSRAILVHGRSNDHVSAFHECQVVSQ